MAPEFLSMPADERWWTQTYGPTKLMDTVMEDLNDRGTVWLNGSMPWPEYFRECVKDHLSLINSAVNIEFVDAAYFPADRRTEELLFGFDPRLRSKFLPAHDLAEFIVNQGALSHTIIWLYNLQGERDRRWTELSRELARRAAGLKVVCQGTDLSIVSKNVSVYAEEDWKNPFDVLLFSMTHLQELCQVRQRRWTLDTYVYVSRLASELANQDAERAATLVNYHDELLEDPITCAEKWIDLTDSAFAENAIRKSQTVSLSPRIDQLRADIIEQMHARLQILLPFIDEYDIVCEKPQDLELRHIVHCESLGKLNLNYPEHEAIHFLYAMRNKISHRQILSWHEVERLLQDEFDLSGSFTSFYMRD